jgi:hypothetical protein
MWLILSEPKSISGVVWYDCCARVGRFRIGTSHGKRALNQMSISNNVALTGRLDHMRNQRRLCSPQILDWLLINLPIPNQSGTMSSRYPEIIPIEITSRYSFWIFAVSCLAVLGRHDLCCTSGKGRMSASDLWWKDLQMKTEPLPSLDFQLFDISWYPAVSRNRSSCVAWIVRLRGRIPYQRSYHRMKFLLWRTSHRL